MKIKQLTQFFCLLFTLFLANNIFAQLGVNATNAAPNSKAMLDVESADKGILIPRLSTAARDGITSPPDGLMIYNNQTKKFNYFDNTVWQESLFGNQWNVSGSNISYSGGFVGIGIASPARNLVINSAAGVASSILMQQTASTGNGVNDGFLLGSNSLLQGEIWNFENSGLIFGTNNLERMRVTNTGNVGIGEQVPDEKLEVNGNVKVIGNLGVGLAGAATQKLDVNGNVKFSGVLNRTATGTTNLVPIAFGTVQDNSIILSGSGNWTITDLGTGHKKITVTGVSLNISTHTVVGSTFAGAPRFANFLIITGELEVFTYTAAPVLFNTPFSFVIYSE